MKVTGAQKKDCITRACSRLQKEPILQRFGQIKMGDKPLLLTQCQFWTQGVQKNETTSFFIGRPHLTNPPYLLKISILPLPVPTFWWTLPLSKIPPWVFRAQTRLAPVNIYWYLSAGHKITYLLNYCWYILFWVFFSRQPTT